MIESYACWVCIAVCNAVVQMSPCKQGKSIFFHKIFLKNTRESELQNYSPSTGFSVINSHRLTIQTSLLSCMQGGIAQW